MKPAKFLIKEYTEFLYSTSVPINFPQMQKPFPSVHSKSSQREPAKYNKTHVTKFQNQVQLLSLEKITRKQRRDVLVSEKGLQLIKSLLLPSLAICLDMEQFVLVPASVNNNKCLNTQTVTKPELPKYQVESQNPTYQIVSLKKEINEKLLAKADHLVDKLLCCPHIKLSNSQTLILDDVQTGVCLSDVAEQHRRNNADVTDIYYFTWRCWYIWNFGSESKYQSQRKREKRVPFKIRTSEAAKVVHSMPCY